MTYTFKLSRRLARFRALGLLAASIALASCNGSDTLDPTNNPSSTPGGEAVPAGPQAASAFAGGIPFGTSAQPASAFGARFNGALQNNGSEMLDVLAQVKARGGRVAIMLAGNERYYKDAAGHFDLGKWKARVDRYRTINFSSYITDGTIIGHYLIDEPNDPHNWNGVPISPATVDAMAQYSKQIWPGMATIARVEPSYFPSGMKYLDAAWAQYLARRGDVHDYIRRVVGDAQSRGLALVVGLNLIDGGVPNLTAMSPSEVETFGSALLSSSYPCAFISWHYDDAFMANNAMGTALDRLRSMAQNRSTRSCRAGSGSDPVPPPPPPPPPDSQPASQPGQTPSGTALPFGVFQAPAASYSNRWTGSVYRADPGTLAGRLADAKAYGIRSVVNLAWPARVKNADGTFNLTKWKGEVDRFRSLSLGQYVSSKTLYAHLLVDQPNCASCWGGKAIPWETVEAMAKYSKSIWPALPTAAKVAPSALAKATFPWTYLDAGWATYNTRQGDLRTYLASEAKAAGGKGLGLMFGLNLVNSGGGSTQPMTASQIMQLGTIAAKSSGVCALVGWRYDASYLGQAGIRAALDSVAKVARSRSIASCAVN